MVVERLLLACETGHIDKLPRTGSVARPLLSDATCSPLGTLLGFLFFTGLLNEGHGPS